MSAEQSPRARITLIEVLAALVVVGLLLTVLLPALDCGRNAHRTRCMNNLRQLALAVHIYHTTHRGHLPPGTITCSAKDPDDRLSLFVSLMPYLEAGQHFKSLDLAQGWRVEKNRPMVSVAMPSYRCPSPPFQEGEGPNYCTYVGCAGYDEDAASLPAKHPRAGMFGHDRELNVSSAFPDGSSQTLMFLETTRNNGPWAAGGRPTLRYVDPHNLRPVRDGGAFGLVHDRSRLPWRSGPAVSNVALADGGGRTIGEQISVSVLKALSTVAGGEELGDW